MKKRICLIRENDGNVIAKIEYRLTVILGYGENSQKAVLDAKKTFKDYFGFDY